MIIKIHRPSVNFPSINIREKRGKDQINEQNLHDSLSQIEPNRPNNKLKRVLLINFEKEQKQPEKLENRTQTPDFQQIRLQKCHVLFQQEIIVLLQKNYKQ